MILSQIFTNLTAVQMLHSPETPKPRQLPCEAIYREGRFIGRVQVEAIRPTETGTAVDMVLLETLANWVCVPIAIEDLEPVVGQRWTSTNNCRFRERIVSVTLGTTTEGCVDQGKLAAWTRMRVYPC